MLCEMSFSEDTPDQVTGQMSKATGFKSTLSVKLDPTTGTLVGWDSLYSMIGMSDPALPQVDPGVIARLKRPIYQID